MSITQYKQILLFRHPGPFRIPAASSQQARSQQPGGSTQDHFSILSIPHPSLTPSLTLCLFYSLFLPPCYIQRHHQHHQQQRQQQLDNCSTAPPHHTSPTINRLTQCRKVSTKHYCRNQINLILNLVIAGASVLQRPPATHTHTKQASISSITPSINSAPPPTKAEVERKLSVKLTGANIPRRPTKVSVSFRLFMALALTPPSSLHTSALETSRMPPTRPPISHL